MKLTPVVMIGFVLAVLAAPVLEAAEFGVRAGRYIDAEEEFVGIEASFGEVFVFNPNIEYMLNTDEGTLVTGNADVLYMFSRSRLQPYVGAGLGVLFTDSDFGGSETDILANAIGGIRFNLDFLEPYVQLKYFRVFDGGGDDLALTVGLRF